MRILFLLPLLVLQGCAALHRELPVHTADLGCVISSLEDERTSLRKLFGNALVSQGLRRAGTNEVISLDFNLSLGQPGAVKYSDPESSGVVHVRFVPPGEYLIDHYFLYYPRLGGGQYATPRAFSVPFAVNAGKCVYLGRSVLHHKEYEVRWVSKLPEDFAVAKGLLPPQLAAQEPATISPFSIPSLTHLER
jgi:hypothetical protein